MTRHLTVSLELPDDLLLALGQAARAAGTDPAHYVRSILRTSVSRTPARLRARDEDLRLAVLLASDWLDLQRRLRAGGHVLRLSDAGDLVVHSWPRNRAILPIEAIGHSLADLCLRYGAAFPGEILARRKLAPRKPRAA